jgi:putative glycosyltransferase (TIGR04372 family)
VDFLYRQNGASQHIFSRQDVLIQNIREKNLEISKLLDDPFIIFHIREAKSTSNRSANNNPIEDYVPAMHLAASKGYRVIRMGDSSMTPLSHFGTLHSLIFDYAHSKLKNEMADLLLWSHATFSVATSSGPAWIPNDFGIPTLFTNAPHIGNMHSIRGFVMPQLIFSHSHKRLLSISEIIDSQFGWNNSEYNAEYSRVRNTSQDILKGVEFFTENHEISNQSYDEEGFGSQLLAMPLERNFKEKLEAMKLL